jgi:hypothetical protein
LLLLLPALLQGALQLLPRAPQSSWVAPLLLLLLPAQQLLHGTLPLQHCLLHTICTINLWNNSVLLLLLLLLVVVVGHLTSLLLLLCCRLI